MSAALRIGIALMATIIFLETIDSRPLDDIGHIVALLRNRGFGCGGPSSRNEEQCFAHCRRIVGHKGGYCDAIKGWFICTCY